MATNYIALSVPVFFVLIGLELAWSSWKGLKLYHLSDAISNISCGIGQQLTGIFFKTALFFFYYWLFQHTRMFTIPQTGIWWLILFIAVDFCYYWFHRLSHEINAIWATHIVHHQSEEYNLTVALRQSWFQGFFSSLFYLPLAILGFDPLMTITVIAFNTLYQFWIHTELIRHMGWFEYVFNTPSHHRVHHGSNPEYIDKNHGGTLIIWDRLFGTFQPEKASVVYGITTPLKSWDPFRANFHYWSEIIQLAKRSHRFSDKLFVFVAPPGWKPQELGGREYAKPISRKMFHKFQVLIPSSVSAYVFVQFVFVLGASSFMLFQSVNFNLTDLILPIGVLLFSLMSFGRLLEAQSYARILEMVRLLLLPIGVYALGFQFLAVLSAAAFSLISGLLLYPITFRHQ